MPGKNAALRRYLNGAWRLKLTAASCHTNRCPSGWAAHFNTGRRCFGRWECQMTVLKTDVRRATVPSAPRKKTKRRTWHDGALRVAEESIRPLVNQRKDLGPQGGSWRRQDEGGQPPDSKGVRSQAQAKVLVSAPTRTIIRQWEEELTAASVATYFWAAKNGGVYDLVVYDECHSLLSPVRAESAGYKKPDARIGLSATREKARRCSEASSRTSIGEKRTYLLSK